ALQPRQPGEARLHGRGRLSGQRRRGPAPRRARGRQPRGPMIAPGELVVDVTGVTKRFAGKTAVNAVSLQVRRGEIFGFLGPNGSGKTTFIRMLCGLLTPDAGSGTCLGYDILTGQRHIKLEVGYMTQKFSYYEELTIRENLDFIGRIYGIPDRAAAVDQSLERLGLRNRGAQLAGELSGGWKQRLALAASLIHKPQLLLLDEPTAGVDPKARREFWDELHRLSAEGGTVAEVVGTANLCTWSVAGPDLGKLSEALRGQPGVEQVVPFGETLHVTGRDAKTLEGTIARTCGPGQEFARIPCGLEDVFIGLMDRAKDTYS